MKDKATFWKNMSIVIVVALLGILLIASYFIPVISPTKMYEAEREVKYSCCDIVNGMNATTLEDVEDPAVYTAWRCVSINEGTAGQLVRVVGVLGMINAMIGAVILICAVATIFFKMNILRLASLGFAIASVAISVAMIAIICVYLGIDVGSVAYAFYYEIHAASFVMLAASLFAGVGSWFLGFFDKHKAKQE